MSHPPPSRPAPHPALDAAQRGRPQGDAHAAPHRDAVPGWALWTGLFGGPLLWSVQTLANYAVVAHGCFPTAEPRSTPSFAGMWGGALAVSVVAAAGTAAATLLALRSWRATRDEKAGRAGSLLDTADGRTRFMAITGLLLSGLFLLAVLSNTLPLFMVGSCA